MRGSSRNATLRNALDRVAHEGDASEPALVQALLDALHREDVGIAERREAAANATIREIIDAAADFEGKHVGSGEMRQRALRQQAATLVRELHAATGHAQAKAATFGPRPEGYRRALWGELTDIAYEQGAPLPDTCARSMENASRWRAIWSKARTTSSCS